MILRLALHVIEFYKAGVFLNLLISLCLMRHFHPLIILRENPRDTVGSIRSSTEVSARREFSNLPPKQPSQRIDKRFESPDNLPSMFLLNSTSDNCLNCFFIVSSCVESTEVIVAVHETCRVHRCEAVSHRFWGAHLVGLLD